MITSTFILKKTAASYDNRRTAIGLLSVFVLPIVHILGRVSGTGNRHPIPMDRVPTTDCQLSIICWHLKPTPKLSSNPNPNRNPPSSKKTPLAYQSFYF